MEKYFQNTNNNTNNNNTNNNINNNKIIIPNANNNDVHII
jgi:hypothetical protein